MKRVMSQMSRILIDRYITIQIPITRGRNQYEDYGYKEEDFLKIQKLKKLKKSHTVYNFYKHRNIKFVTKWKERCLKYREYL